MDRLARVAIKLGLEEQLGALNAHKTFNVDLRTVWESVRRVRLAAVEKSLNVQLPVLGDVAELLFNLAHNFELSLGV